ncbi:hypothetical protein F2P81_008086 [Scophthalmus maximus]|uniref:Uncharacterized protein n=1 Tax=Scophthalmus maximus TaxID=52904 RepID=A0A6A4TA46_SCOMX|nr:hypothetical protein F2P81_008086 [Scophthalmus maximus]
MYAEPVVDQVEQVFFALNSCAMPSERGASPADVTSRHFRSAVLNHPPPQIICFNTVMHIHTDTLKSH